MDNEVFYIDNLNKRILQALSKNSRKSFRKLAEELGVSTVTVINRVEAMEKAGIIKNFGIEIDFKELGFDLFAIIIIRLKSNEYIKEVIKKLETSHNVLRIFEVSGENDLITLCVFRNAEELTIFTKKILTSNQIEKSATHLVISEYKFDISNILL